MFRRLRELLALSIALSATPLLAHDLWIEPSSFAPRLGQVVDLRLRVGQNLAGDPLPFIPTLVRQFIVQDAADRKPVTGRRGSDPAGALRVVVPGLQIVGYLSHPSRVVLAADKFNAYLVEEGLDDITELRSQRHQAGMPARELFVRCAKSLLQAGPPSEAQGDRLLGFPLELVAERNPYVAVAGQSQDLSVRLTFEQAPLANALVVAMNSRDPSEKQAARADADGRVQFRLRPGGMWLIKAVHMVAAPAGTDADWVSFWASLAFEAAGAKPD